MKCNYTDVRRKKREKAIKVKVAPKKFALVDDTQADQWVSFLGKSFLFLFFFQLEILMWHWVTQINNFALSL
jgi:hypothetical protein